MDDIPVRQGTLFAKVFDSPVAHGKITRLDLSQAENLPGVIQIFTEKDIPGENQIGGIIPDEPLLAEGEVHFQGQPIALVVAETEAIATEAVKKITVEIDPLPIITDPRIAAENGELFFPPRIFRIGDSQVVFVNCKYVFEGKAETNGQEHLYIETQGAYAYPVENEGIHIFSSTQGPTAVQRTAARVLGISMNKIEVEVTRLGGGFGGKES
ncbi:MAG: molybdopterin cofactor-binding domain-containing protein, partial [Bacteroidota bacterium]